MNFLEAMTEKDSVTYNGALTNSTSHNRCLDLFFLAGACRNESEKNIIAKLSSAYEEDRIKTLKIIFWAGDIRQGAGERRFFKIAITWLSKNHQEDFITYTHWIPEFSRWDVLFEIDEAFDFIIKNLRGNETSPLLCKWLPRKKQYNNLAKKIQKAMNWTPKQYRKFLVENTKVVEQKMCKKEWSEIIYSKVPSVAINKYNKAWYRNDGERFEQYLKDVKEGKSKINASAIFPHDIIKSAFSKWMGWYGDDAIELNEAQITQWNNLPNWLHGKTNSMIPVCDVSGSMSGTPICISVALGLYISERNIGPFKDAFITFSADPTMNILSGDINQRIQQLIQSEWGMNTDFNKVFDMILNKAIEYKLSPEDVPQTILAISDMEFDVAEENHTSFEVIERKYNEAGYKRPNIVFWNVNGRAGNVPVTMNDKGVALISGASPSIIRSVLSNDISPLDIMNSTIESERYSFIK